MAQPKTLRQGAALLTPPIPGGASVKARGFPFHDVIPNPISGWHVTVKDHFIPVGGYAVGYSDDNVHFSQGPSHGAQGVPASPAITSPQTYDATQTGYGSDGRASLDGTTYGGATGAAGVGGGGGSPARGF